MEAWQRIAEADIVAVCDLDRQKARDFSSQHGVPVFYSRFDELLRLEQLDFIDIATRPDSHRSLVEKAAQSDVAVLCQKPLAPTFEDAVAMVAFCEARHVRFMVNENWRWQRWYREIRGLLQAGTIGRPWHVAVRMRIGDGRGQTPYRVQPYFREMPRFLLYETVVHFIDTLRFLIAEVRYVHAVTRRRNPAIAGEDVSLLMLEFAEGQTGLIDANRLTDPDKRGDAFGRVMIEGDEGAIVLEENGEIFVKLNRQAPVKHAYPLPGGYRGDSCYEAQRHFVQSLLLGTPFETCGRDYLNTLAVLEAAYQAAETGRAVAPAMRAVNIGALECP